MQIIGKLQENQNFRVNYGLDWRNSQPMIIFQKALNYEDSIDWN